MFAALLMLLPLLAVSAATAPRVEAASRPTIVLVHGAWAGPDGWDTVVAGLQKDGYRMSTPALGLQSTYADVAIVRNALDAIPGNKIIRRPLLRRIGHLPGRGRADRRARPRIYTAAFVPDAGETLIGLGAGYQPPAALQPGHGLPR